MGIIMLKVGRAEGWLFREDCLSYFGGGPGGQL